MSSSTTTNVKKKLVRNKKVACTRNCEFLVFTCPTPIQVSEATIDNLAKLGPGILNDKIPKHSDDLFMTPFTDIDKDSFDAKILKHRKTIRFQITQVMQQSLFFGEEEPCRSIFAYLYDRNTKALHLYNTENMKAKSSRNIIKFDVFKKIKIASFISNFNIGLMALIKSSDSETLNACEIYMFHCDFVFDRMIDNEKKRKKEEDEGGSTDEDIPNTIQKFTVPTQEVSSEDIVFRDIDEIGNQSKFKILIKRAKEKLDHLNQWYDMDIQQPQSFKFANAPLTSTTEKVLFKNFLVGLTSFVDLKDHNKDISEEFKEIDDLMNNYFE